MSFCRSGFVLCGLALLLAIPVFAQYTVGRVSGSVTDSSGAMVNGAQVGLRNLGTNATRTFLTGTDGLFAFMALPPGDYELSAEAPRFARSTTVIHVRTSETLTQNLTLTVSTEATTVDVVVAPGQIDVADPQQSTTRTELELSSLPTLGRNMINVVTLAPGVQPTNNPRGSTTFGGGGSYVIVLGVQSGLIAANGGRARATAIQLDYTDANDWQEGGFAPGMQAISPDMLQEFKLLTSNYSAEYGVKANAQVLMVTRSGSNKWRGSLSEYLQNDAFNARDYFDTTGKPTPLKQNIYGASLGGPIRKNRTFVFGAYEGRRVRGGGFTQIARVPSASARTRATDPIIIDLMNRFLPAATGATADPDIGTVAVQIPSPIDTYQMVLKGDHHFSPRHSISARYLQSTADFIARFPSQNALPGFDLANHFELRNLNLSETFVVSPRTVNELRLAYGYTSAQGRPQNGLNTPRFNITGLVGFGALASSPSGRIFNVYQVNDTFSHVHGAHVVKVGVDARKIQDNSLNATNTRGVFTFASLNSFLAATPTLWTQLFGDTSRGFRTGVYGAFVQDDWKLKPTLTINLGLRWELQGAISEAHGLSSVLDPNLPGPVGAAGPGPLGSFRIGREAIGSNPLNFAPRVGFAWNPKAGNFVLRGGYGVYWDSFTFSPLNASRSVPPVNYSPSLSCVSLPTCQIAGGNSFDHLVNGTASSQALYATLAANHSFGSLANFGSVTTVDSNLANPYVQEFNLTTEYRFRDNYAVSLAYVGTKATHLTRLVPINPLWTRPAPATSTADEQARFAAFANAFRKENGAGNWRLDPRFDQVNLHDGGGSSVYHSLQAQLRKNFARGLQFQASYTWSKSIDDASDFAPTAQANDNGFAQDAANLRAERAVSNYDIPHRVVVTAIWQLPFFHHLKGLPRHVLDGWSFESVNMWQSGLPATLLAGSRTVSSGGQTLTVTDVNFDGNIIPGGSDNTRASCSAGAQFRFGATATASEFAQPLLGNNGTCGRNSIRMNALTNFDWSFFKNFAVAEHGPFGTGPWELQFRSEFYNIFNLPFRTATGDGWRTVSNPASFAINNAAALTRRVQFALRLSW